MSKPINEKLKKGTDGWELGTAKGNRKTGARGKLHPKKRGENSRKPKTLNWEAKNV